jgi:hypothetical protein
MPLERLSNVDELGDNATHFFKSGNIVRNKGNDDVAELKNLLPLNGPNHTNVEYDIWYDMGDPKRIHGYTYTDMMSKFILIRIAGKYWSDKQIREACTGEITEEGLSIYNDIVNNSVDKYRLRKNRKTHDFVIFLPGTNILYDACDFPKLHRAVKQGAKLKCHPITANWAVTKLRQEFGDDNVLDKKLSGHQLLEEATTIGACDNSEMGIIAAAKGKNVHLFGNPNNNYTYSSLYHVIFQKGNDKQDMLKRLFSSKVSGIIPVNAENPKEYVDNFFNKFKEFEHVRPKHSHT